MSTIMITGATDGIGLATAEHLATLGHQLVLHGRNPVKLDAARKAVEARRAGSVTATLIADLSMLAEVDALADAAADLGLDVLINNAGVYHTDRPVTTDGLDVRFVVNTIAPYLLTRRLLPNLPPNGRVVNLSSAAQAPVDLRALAGDRRLGDGAAYAQSKLAIAMWTRHIATEIGADGPVIVAVNPGSLLATKMVREGYGIAGNDIRIGVDALTRAATGDEFAAASGRYFDNDSGRFASPHPDALDAGMNAALVAALDEQIAALTSS
ncbi:SDR family NAD(P)-dependent oxidoreductase [Ilumatobacter coccineus]|uniref:Putative oxidoreductase n=1 Tax=Ilumatobacter coccineus (strain NBRC 103263 / KCTC 29153 / YM16-304) TaxID=1313172 RepID=A0A6C7DWC0_ILUCY|nr:SDR family NAD(P)-dependent oxidoreductase [Ilumatobacter coccineus]BAN00894.1 putative oxidoreductase [Ilumatobacter coccineus YM16-304]